MVPDDVPAAYRPLYDELAGNLLSLTAGVPLVADVHSPQSWPQLNNASDHAALPFGEYALDFIKNEIHQHVGWGSTGVCIHICCPGLDPTFYAGGEEDPALLRNRDVWQQAIDYAHSCGLSVMIEGDVTLGEQDSWRAWLSRLSWTEYVESRARHAAAVAALGPDWISVLCEPDSEQTSVGQPVATIERAMSLVDTVGASVRAANPAVKVAAGCGTWMPDYTGPHSWVAALLETAVDAIDFHVYPCYTPRGQQTSMVARVYDLIAAVSGTKQIVSTELWMNKQGVSDAGVEFATIEARNPFTFWYALDAQFLATMQALQRKTPNFVAICPSYPMEYQTALPLSYLDRPAAEVAAALSAAYGDACQMGAISPLGQDMATVFSPPDVLPPPLASLGVVARDRTSATLAWTWALPQQRQLCVNLFRDGHIVYRGAGRPGWLFSYRDTGLTRGTTYVYTATANDPWANTSPSVSCTVTIERSHRDVV